MPVAPSPIRLRLEAERLAGALPPLLLAAERVAATVAAGIHGRRRSGPGDSFWQYRPYQATDPVQAIDWRRSARATGATAPLYVRQREWEVAQTAVLWCDASPSMAYRSGLGSRGLGGQNRGELPDKADRARLLTAALAALLLRGGERVALLRGAMVPRPGVGRGALERLIHDLEEAAPSDEEHPLADPPSGATAILIGDFLEPSANLAPWIKRAGGRRVRVHLVQVLDPAEESLPFRGRTRFAGTDGEPPLLVPRAEDLRAAYVRRLARHREELRALAQATGGGLAVHHTDGSPEQALMGLLTLLQEPAGWVD